MFAGSKVEWSANESDKGRLSADFWGLEVFFGDTRQNYRNWLEPARIVPTSLTGSSSELKANKVDLSRKSVESLNEPSRRERVQ